MPACSGETISEHSREGIEAGRVERVLERARYAQALRQQSGQLHHEQRVESGLEDVGGRLERLARDLACGRDDDVHDAVGRGLPRGADPGWRRLLGIRTGHPPILRALNHNARTGRLTVDVAETVRAFSPEEWDAVVQRARAPVFYRHAMLLAYEDAPLQSIAGIRYLGVRDASTSQLVAVSPLYLVPRQGAFASRVAAVTHAFHWYETCVPALSSDDTVLDAVWSGFESASAEAGASTVAFVNVHRGSRLAHFLESRGNTLVPVGRTFSLDLTGFSSSDEYRSSLRRSIRRELARHGRRGVDAGAEISIEAPPAAVPAVVGMCRHSAARHQNDDWYPQQALTSFLYSAPPPVHLVVIRLGDRVVSGSVCFSDPERLYVWAGGDDYDCSPSFSPAYLSWNRIIDLAFELGVSRIEGGRMAGDFKTRLGFQAVDLLSLVASGRGR
jgi:predicted N-acyltransferase